MSLFPPASTPDVIRWGEPCDGGNGVVPALPCHRQHCSTVGLSRDGASSTIPWYPGTLTWLQAAASTPGICMAFGGNTGFRHQQYQDHWPTPGPQWLHGHGLGWIHMPPTSAWLPNAAKPEDITKALTRGTDCMSPSQASSQSGPQTPTRPLVVSRTTVVLYGGKLKKETFPHLGPWSLPRARDSTARWQVQGLSLHLHKLQAVAHHSAYPSGQWHLSRPLHCQCRISP